MRARLVCSGTRRARRVGEGPSHRRSLGRLALGGVLAAVLAGCADETKTVTGDTSAAFVESAPSTSVEAAPSTTTAAMAVPAPVIARVKRSVLPVFCADPDIGDGFVGTGFRVSNGVVTASHVVAACPPATTISIGDGSGTASASDPTHDLALVTYKSDGHAHPDWDPDPRLLRPESRLAYVGEPLALLGIPAFSTLGNPFKRHVAVLPGTVVATHHSQVLTSDQGTQETLRNTIEVAAPGIVRGQSGGPAINAAGKVVGVIVGSASGFATLTRVTDLPSLH